MSTTLPHATGDVPALLRTQADAVMALADTQARVLRALADAVEAGGGTVSQRPVASPQLLTKQQTATALNVSLATIDRGCRAGEIPFVLIGESRRFDLAEVRAALQARAAQPAAPTSGPRVVAAAPTATGVKLLSRARRTG